MQKRKAVIRYDIIVGSDVYRKLVYDEAIPATIPPFLILFEDARIESRWVEHKAASPEAIAEHVIVYEVPKEPLEKEREKARIIGFLIKEGYNNPNASY